MLDGFAVLSAMGSLRTNRTLVFVANLKPQAFCPRGCLAELLFHPGARLRARQGGVYDQSRAEFNRKNTKIGRGQEVVGVEGVEALRDDLRDHLVLTPSPVPQGHRLEDQNSLRRCEKNRPKRSGAQYAHRFALVTPP